MLQPPGVDTNGWNSDGWSDIYTGEVNMPLQAEAPQPRQTEPAPSYLDMIQQAAQHGITIDPSNLVGW